jgi:hypothetical protein
MTGMTALPEGGQSMAEPMLSVPEAAGRLGVDPDFLQDWLDEHRDELIAEGNASYCPVTGALILHGNAG